MTQRKRLVSIINDGKKTGVWSAGYSIDSDAREEDMVLVLPGSSGWSRNDLDVRQMNQEKKHTKI